MKRSEWIAIGSIAAGLFMSTIGSALYLSFKIGGVSEKVATLERTTDKMSTDVEDIKIKIAAMEVKIDVLWHDHIMQSKSTTKK